jgi:transposase
VFAGVTHKASAGTASRSLARQTELNQPKEDNCPECGETLHKLGEDVSEILEYVSARFKVIRHARPKLSCMKCDVIEQAAAPSRPIERGLAGRDYWCMFWYRNTPIINRCTGRRRFMHAKVLGSGVRR